MAPTRQITPAETPVSTPPDPARPQRCWICPERFLSTSSPRRLSAVYLWVLLHHLFGVLSAGHVPDRDDVPVGVPLGRDHLRARPRVPRAADCRRLRSVGRGGDVPGTRPHGLHVDPYRHPAAVAALIVVAASAACGAASGFIIVRLHVNSFIATLGVSQLLLGAVLLLSNNTQLVGDFRRLWSDLGNNDLLGIPIVVYFLLALALVLWYVLEFTRVGRYMFATGGNPDAARLAGVPTDRVIWSVFIASGTIAGLAGVIFSMQSGLYSSSIGPGYLFPAVAAVFLGASQLSRRPNVWGTLIAYFALAFGIQGLVLSAAAPRRSGASPSSRACR